jgi:hypothetical protein
VFRAAPAPLLAGLTEAGARRVLEDVGDGRVEMILVVDHPRIEAIAE